MASFQDETLDSALVRLRRAAGRVLFARRLGLALPLVVFLIGAWVLVARFGLGLGRVESLWGLVALPLAPLVSWLLARRELPERSALVAWLDKRAGGTGEVLTQFELADARWTRRAIQACQQHGATESLPEPELGTAVWGSLPAGLFVALALWFSPPAPPAPLPVGLFGATLERLAERVGDLEELGLLEPDKLAELAERLEDIQASLDAGGLEQGFEALDRFQEDLAQLGRDHAEQLADLREAALAAAGGQSEELGQALAAALSDPAMAELVAQAVKGLGESGLPADLSGLDPAGLEALGGALSAELAGKLAELAQAGFLDARGLEAALARRAKPRSLDDLEFKHAPDCASRSGGL